MELNQSPHYAFYRATVINYHAESYLYLAILGTRPAEMFEADLAISGRNVFALKSMSIE